MALVALGVVFLVVAIVVLHSSTKPGVAYQEVSFSTEGLGGDPVTVSGLLMKPAGEAAAGAPGVVFAHGITASKEWYIQMTRPLVEAGFVVLSIDLRGHGGSDGYCTFGRDEIYDFWAAADFLKENVPEVDPEHIVAMGHSLGGISATRAGALDTQDRYSAVAAVYCWTGWREALESFLGPIDDFVGRGWQFTTFSRHLDINSPDLAREYSILDLVNDTRPPNYLLAAGSSDELVSAEQETAIIEKMTERARAEPGEDVFKMGYTYGSFDDGTARRLVLTDDDHVTELASGEIVNAAIDWIKQDAGTPPMAEAPAPFLWTRILGIVALIISMMFLSMGTLSLVKPRLFPGYRGELTVSPPWGLPGEQGVWEILLYSGAVVVASYLALPLAKTFGIGPFISYSVVNELSLFFVARSIVLSPVFVALLLMIVLGSRDAKSFLSGKLKASLRLYAANSGYALVPLAVIIIIMLILGGPLLLPRSFAGIPGYFFLGIICITAGLWLEDYMFYKLVYPAVEKHDVHKRRRMAVLIHGVVLDLVLVFALLPIMKGIGVKIHLFNFDVPLVVLLLACIPVFLFAAYISMRMRRATGSSLAYSLMMSAVAVWLFTGPVGVRGF